MKKLLLFLEIVLIGATVFAQSVTLTFTANHTNYQNVRLDRVTITNLTKGWQETIYWPDTTMTMQNGTGINDVERHGGASLQLLQNNPNPFTGTTEVNLTVAIDGEVMHGASSTNANPSGVQGVCPNGWHVPSDSEWTQLTSYVSSQTYYWCDNSSSF